MNEKKAKKFRRLSKLMDGPRWELMYKHLKKEDKRNALAGLNFPSRKPVECTKTILDETNDINS